MAAPLIALTTGLDIFGRASCSCMASSARCSAAWGACGPLNSARSAPAQEPRPAPVRTIAPTPSSRSAAASASSNPCVSSLLSALRFSGRFSVMIRTAPRPSTSKTETGTDPIYRPHLSIRIEERRLAFAAQADVEAVAARAIASGHQALASLYHGVEHRVGRVIEEHDGVELAHEPGIEKQEIDMRRPPWTGTGLDRPKGIDSVGVGRGAAPAEEVRIVEPSLRIGLPDLEHQVVERPAIGLHHASGDLDRVALRIGREVVRAGCEFA